MMVVRQKDNLERGPEHDMFGRDGTGLNLLRELHYCIDRQLHIPRGGRADCNVSSYYKNPTTWCLTKKAEHPKIDRVPLQVA